MVKVKGRVAESAQSGWQRARPQASAPLPPPPPAFARISRAHTSGLVASMGVFLSSYYLRFPLESSAKSWTVFIAIRLLNVSKLYLRPAGYITWAVRLPELSARYVAHMLQVCRVTSESLRGRSVVKFPSFDARCTVASGYLGPRIVLTHVACPATIPTRSRGSSRMCSSYGKGNFSDCSAC